MEFLKSVTTKVFNPDSMPLGTCIRVKGCTLKNDFEYNIYI